MNKLTLAVSGLFLCTVYCPAEMLDSVTFNPARLGQYERLKVSDDLTSPGGVEARSLSVRSNGAVSVNNAGNYKIPQAEVKGSLDMTSTEFEAPIVDSRGGKASFERTNPNISSHIEQLTGNVLKAKANVLRAQEISVLGSRSTDYEDNQIQGLKLGGNDIPNREGCSGLNWYARTAGDGNTYKVLGMGSCTGGAEEEKCDSLNQSEECCTKRGYKWDAEYDECVQTCSGYELSSEKLEICRDQRCNSKSTGNATFWSNSSSYGPFYYIQSKYGSCQEGEGSSQSNSPDWGYYVITGQYDTQAALSDTWREENGVTCQYQKSNGAMDPITPAQNTCVVYLSHVFLRNGIAYSADPPYGAAILSCVWKESTWECPAESSRCGEEFEECL